MNIHVACDCGQVARSARPLKSTAHWIGGRRTPDSWNLHQQSSRTRMLPVAVAGSAASVRVLPQILAADLIRFPSRRCNDTFDRRSKRRECGGTRSGQDVHSSMEVTGHIFSRQTRSRTCDDRSRNLRDAKLAMTSSSNADTCSEAPAVSVTGRDRASCASVRDAIQLCTPWNRRLHWGEVVEICHRFVCPFRPLGRTRSHG